MKSFKINNIDKIIVQKVFAKHNIVIIFIYLNMRGIG